MLSYQATRRFEEDYKGVSVNWSGILHRATTGSYDLVFGGGDFTKATLELCTLDSGPYGKRTIKAIVAFPKNDFDDLQSMIDETVQFRGTLVKCDPFVRNLFLADAELIR